MVTVSATNVYVAVSWKRNCARNVNVHSDSLVASEVCIGIVEGVTKRYRFLLANC